MWMRPGVGGRPSTISELPKQRPASGRQVEVATPVTPGSAAQRRCARYDDAIQPDLLQSRKTARTEEHEEPHRSPCQQQADGRTGNRQKRALGQEVARNAAVARADRSADRDVTLACLGANKEEVRDVRAANQQHKTDGRQENP